MSGKLTCIVVTYFSENQPGFLDFSYRIDALAKNYQVTVISQFELTQAELQFKNLTNHIIRIGHGKLGWMTYILRCANYVRKHQPDILVLLHSATAPISLFVCSTPVCLYWNEHPTNLAHVVKGFLPVRNSLAKMVHWLVFYGAKRADLIMPIGEDHYEDLIRHGVEVAKIKFLYMGVADYFRQENALPHTQEMKPIHFMYIGTVSQARGRDVMLNAMAILSKETIISQQQNALKLTIIGATEAELAFCQQRVEDLKIAQYVTIKRRLPGYEIPQYLAQADVGICLWEPNQWNQFNPPTKLFEYLVAGIPVLASNIRTHTRYIHDWQNGLIFDYDETSLAHAILQLYNSKNQIPAFKNHAVISGRQYVWSKIEPVFLSAIKDLIATKQANIQLIK